MRAAPLLVLAAAVCRAEAPFGTWKVDPAISTVLIGDRIPKAVTIRFEPHPKGEVFTVERIEIDGRTVTSSSILYLDGKPREVQGPPCSGTQSSRRTDDRSIEILRRCTTGEWSRIIRRLRRQSNQLVLEITEQRSSGRFERRVVLETRRTLEGANALEEMDLGGGLRSGWRRASANQPGNRIGNGGRFL